MRHVDLTPLMRATVGFDRLTSLLDTASRVDEATLSYPPYNIEKTAEDAYRISIAVAGFTPDDLSVEVKDGSLLVSLVNRCHQVASRAVYDRREHLVVRDGGNGDALVDVLQPRCE